MLDATQPTSAELARIKREAMQAFTRDIPDPEQFAWSLPKPYCFWIQRAWRSQDPANSGCWRVSATQARGLFPMGLCDNQGYLTAFGNAVRKAIEEQAS